MTKEQLEKKAIKKASELNLQNVSLSGIVRNRIVEILIEFSNEVTKELQTQTEKMKCCFNCKHSRTEYEHCKTDKHEKWELRRSRIN